MVFFRITGTRRLFSSYRRSTRPTARDRWADCHTCLLIVNKKNIGKWFTDLDGKRWTMIGTAWGMVSTILCIFIAISFPARDIFSAIESQFFFELVNPAILLLLSFAVLSVVAFKRTESTRTVFIALFTAFFISFIIFNLNRISF